MFKRFYSRSKRFQLEEKRQQLLNKQKETIQELNLIIKKLILHQEKVDFINKVREYIKGDINCLDKTSDELCLWVDENFIWLENIINAKKSNSNYIVFHDNTETLLNDIIMESENLKKDKKKLENQLEEYNIQFKKLKKKL